MNETPSEVHFFATPAEFRAWLEAHHETATEIIVGFFKKGAGRPTMAWSDAVDQALCFGWIDGVRRSLDAERYTNRFTPRRRGSTWSAVNIAKVAELTAAGLMHPAGLRAFEARDPAKSGVYSFEQGERRQGLPPAYEAQVRADPAAWAFWEAQPPGYRRTAAWWVVSAKQEATRQRRLATLIADAAAGRRIALLARPARKPAPPGSS